MKRRDLLTLSYVAVLSFTGRMYTLRFSSSTANERQSTLAREDTVLVLSTEDMRVKYIR